MVIFNTEISKCFNDEISCVFATDDNYAPYLSVAITSIIENSNKHNNYGIYILEENISENNRKLLKSLETENIKIKFVNTKSFIDKYRNILHLNSYITIATYYRFFIPELFSNFDKLVYLDCDLIVNCDIANLYNIDLKNNIVACVRDIPIASKCYLNLINETNKNYYLNTLKLDKIDNYFNAGVMLFDVNKLKEFNCTEKCINLLQEIKTPKYSDQCILNSVLKDNVLLIDFKWNFQNALAYPKYTSMGYENVLPMHMLPSLLEAVDNPKIIHYICAKKPWNNLNLINGEYFWEYARKSPYYEKIMYNLFQKEYLTQNKKHKNHYNLFEYIFSIKNSADKRYKVTTILGIKIKTKSKKSN